MTKWKPTKEEVELLAGPECMREEYSLAKRSSKKLRELLDKRDYVHALGAINGNQAMQMVKAGLEAIYLSGWQTASSNNSAGQMYPDQSLYPVNSVPNVVREINNTFKRCAQIDHMNEKNADKWLCPIIADGEAAFGGPLNSFELTKAMIEAGAAAIHLEDQLSSAKKCGHLGGKVLVPASEHIKKLKAARLAAEVCGVDTVIIARTDANSARLITSIADEEDHKFIYLYKGETPMLREYPGELYGADTTSEGFYHITGGIDMAISRGLQYAPYADLLWCETSTPSLREAKRFADAIHAKFPNQKLAYNCSPSFNWKENLTEEEISQFQVELGVMGYAFQFVTLAGFHNLNYHMFDLAKAYDNEDMIAYSRLQQWEINTREGYTADKHQAEVGVGYFDKVSQTIDQTSSTLAMKDSTEDEQFE